MIEFEKHISTYWTTFPEKKWSFLSSPEEAQVISSEHKDQINFLNKEGTDLIKDYMYLSKMVDDFPHKPFINFFKTVESFNISLDCNSELKRWLHDIGVPFSKYVFIDSDRNGQAVMLTWKMVIKYWEGLFFLRRHSDF